MFNFIPFKFRVIRKFCGNHDLVILDIGCGDNSPEKTRRYLDVKEYHGVDRMEYNVSSKGCDKIFWVDMNNKEEFQAFKNTIIKNYYDVIILNHVLEHLTCPADMLKLVIDPLKPCGIIYIEYPRLESVNFPSARGTLNFYDDHTHTTLIADETIIRFCNEHNLRLLRFKVKRDWIKIVLWPFLLVTHFIINRPSQAGLFWNILGFAKFAVIQKR